MGTDWRNIQVPPDSSSPTPPPSTPAPQAPPSPPQPYQGAGTGGLQPPPQVPKGPTGQPDYKGTSPPPTNWRTLPVPTITPTPNPTPQGDLGEDPSYVQYLVRNAARENNIPEDIAIGVARTETGGSFKQSSYNQKSGATGVMQIVPHWHPDINVKNVESNVYGGMSILAGYYKQFKSWPLALAAYNAGPGNVENGKWLTFPETRGYVDSIMGKGTWEQYTGQNVKDVRTTPPDQLPPVKADVVNPRTGAHLYTLGGPLSEKAILPPVIPDKNAMDTNSPQRQWGARNPEFTPYIGPRTDATFASSLLTGIYSNAGQMQPNGTIKWKPGFDPMAMLFSLPLGVIKGLTGNIWQLQWDPKKPWDPMAPWNPQHPFDNVPTIPQFFPSIDFTPRANAQANKILARVGMKPLPNGIALPENKTLDEVGQMYGIYRGAIIGGKIAGQAGRVFDWTTSPLRNWGAVKIASKIPTSATLRDMIINRVAASPFARAGTEASLGTHQLVRMLTPLAFGIGGQTALKDATEEVFNGGFLDPAKVGHDAAMNAALVYLLPSAAPLFIAGIKNTFSLAPEALRIAPLPPSMGGFGRQNMPLLSAITGPYVDRLRNFYLTTTVGDYLSAPWRTVFNGLNMLYRYGEAKNTGLADMTRGMADWANRMDDSIKSTVDWWQSSSYKFRGAGSFPKDSPLDPQKIYRDQDFASTPNTRTMKTADGRTITIQYMSGGGPYGEITHRDMGDQISLFAQQLRNEPMVSGGKILRPYRQVANDYQQAADILRRNAGRMGQDQWRQVSQLLTGASGHIRAADAPRLFEPRSTYSGNKRYMPSMEQQWINQIAGWADNMAAINDPTTKLIRNLRSATAHFMLGVWNFTSAVTLLNRLAFPLATEGGEYVARAGWMIHENDPIVQRFREAMNLDEPSQIVTRHPPVIGETPEGEPTVQTPTRTTTFFDKESWLRNLENKSFSIYSWTENKTLPMTAISRYLKNMEVRGLSEDEAWNESLDYTRRLRTTTNYDWPEAAGTGRLGYALRTLMQFFPFGMKSFQFLADLNLGEASQYLTYVMSMAGLKGIPFITAADRFMTMWGGVSYLNALYANPVANRILSGVPGLAFGVDEGSRHNWSSLLTDRVLGMQQAPFLNLFTTAWNAVGESLDTHSGYAFVKATRALLPASVQALWRAEDDEYNGGLMDNNSNIIVGPGQQRPYDYGQVALGLLPRGLSSADAARSGIYESNQYADRLAVERETLYMRNINQGRPWDVPPGMTALEAQRVRKKARMIPEYYWLSRLQKNMRPFWKPIVQMYQR